MKIPTFVGYCQARMIRHTIFCVVLLLFSSGVLTAQKANHAVRNVVLVHGAWADGSGWKGVYDILTKDGYRVTAPMHSI